MDTFDDELFYKSNSVFASHGCRAGGQFCRLRNAGMELTLVILQSDLISLGLFSDFWVLAVLICFNLQAG